MNVILLLEIFTRTYTDIYKYWDYVFICSQLALHCYFCVFCIVMGCACQLVIKEK